jgi:hypothetical protein
MRELNGWRWGAYAGIAAVVLGIVGTVIAVSGGAPPGIADTSKFADYEAGHVGRALAFAWMGSVAFVLLLPFLVSVRQVIRAARGEWEWVAGVAFAAGVSFVVLVVVHFGLFAAVSIDTTVNGDPAALKALFLAGSVIGSTIEWLPAALLMVTVSYVILQSGVLPRWTAWVGYFAAALNLISSLAIFGGGDNRGFFTATGFGGVLFGILPFVVWVASVSIAMLRAPQARPARAT